MSFIVGDLGEVTDRLRYPSRKPQQPPRLPSQGQPSRVWVDSMFKHSSKAPIDSSEAKKKQRVGDTKWWLEVGRIFRAVWVTLEAVMDPKTSKLSFRYRLLDEEGLALRVPSRHRFQLACLNLAGAEISHRTSMLKLFVHPSTGEIEVDLSCSLLPNFSLSNLSSQMNFLATYFKKYHRELHYQFVELLELSTLSPDLLAADMAKRPGQGSGVQKHARNANIRLFLEEDDTTGEGSIESGIRQENRSIQEMKENVESLGEFREPLDLYALSGFETAQKDYLQRYNLSAEGHSELKLRLQLPSSGSSQKANRSVLSFIKLAQPNTLARMRPLDVGGFSSILQGEVAHWPIGSHVFQSQEQSLALKQKPSLKRLVAKREPDSLPAQKSRIQHEKWVIMNMKNAVSHFIPKYFIACDGSNREVERVLFMEQLRVNLGHFLAFMRLTLSLRAKLHLLFLLVQALRYLKVYSVVHLDLKPGNVMVAPNYDLKLIDFGESFHPKVPMRRPGFSMPYSAPENYTYPPKQDYSHKNDVFSLGVIMHEMLTDCHPFFFNSAPLKKAVYTQHTIGQYWFHCSEEARMHGEGVVTPVLQLLVGKCLDQDPARRPELESLALLLKECHELL